MTAKQRTLSRSVEDYLKAIYALSEDGSAAATSQIAELLEVQPASVTGMIKRLAGDGLLEYEPYRGARLTAEGTREALRVVRRHRILETFLSERLGYSWDDVHAEAERLEHAASDELIERMAAAMEHPRHDPHGSPIPSPQGTVDRAMHPTLSEVSVGSLVSIQEVQDDDSGRLRYLQSRGLLPGVILHIDSRAPYEGPTLVRVGGQGGAEQTVGVELARKIRVAPLD